MSLALKPCYIDLKFHDIRKHMSLIDHPDDIRIKRTNYQVFKISNILQFISTMYSKEVKVN